MITKLGGFIQTLRLSPTEQTDAVGLRWTSPKVGGLIRARDGVHVCRQEIKLRKRTLHTDLIIS